MINKNLVWIVIAAYNEQHSISQVLEGLRKAGYENIVVVDDGSRDMTFKLAKKHTKHVLKHIINRGQGAALKTGIDYALSQGAQVIVTFDADGQHRVEDIPAMVEPVLKGKVDITLGSRFLDKKTKVPLLKKIVLKIGALIVGLFYGIYLTDSHNGFRALSRKAAEKIQIKSNRMEHASEIIDEIRRNRLRYKEIPVEILYTEYSKAHGQSIWNAFRILYKMILHKFMR